MGRAVTGRDWTRLRTLLEAALDAPGEDLCAALASFHATPAEAREVEVLLAAERGANGRLEPPGAASADDVLAALESAHLVGQRIGPYRLIGLIATGGMGEVYRAARDDGAFDRVVAIKLIRPGLMSAGARRRFEAERRTLARLTHPNIAALLDGGEFEGRPYLVLEFVEGRRLPAHCDALGLDPRGRVALLRTVCAAVAHAHQNLIVHRDLKPSNVLVTPDGTPKLLDFGISKLLSGASPEDPGATVTRILTPRYASPEQLRGEPVTTASDVYSLGVVLHETLTGRAWGGASGTSGVPQMTGEVPVPSRLARGIDRELDAIVTQALALDPRRRYPSAEALGADLQRYLDGEPVAAYDASRWHRARKWAGRHRLALSLGTAGAILLVGIATASSLVAARLAAERRQTLAAQRDGERINRYLTGMLESAGERALGGTFSLRDLLDDAARRLDGAPAVNPGVAGALRVTLARAYMSMGRSNDAGPLFTRAVADLERAHGGLDPRVARAREDLGRYLVVNGRFDEADGQYRLALGAWRGAEGDAGEGVARCLRRLGHMEMIRERFDAAERILAEAQLIAERSGFEGEIAAILDVRATIAQVTGDLSGADALRSRALELLRRLAPGPSTELAEAIRAMGDVRRAAGDLAGAEPLLREAHAMMTEVAGPARAASSATLRSLTRLLEDRGDLAGAEGLFAGAIAELERALPESRHDWIYLREHLALFLARQGRWDDARPHLAAAAAAYEEMLPPDHCRIRFARECLERAETGRTSPETAPNCDG